MDFRHSLRSLQGRLSTLRPTFQAQRHWLVGLLVILPAMALALKAGRDAMVETEERRETARRLERVRDGMELWITSYRPPTPAESLSWKSSERAVEALKVPLEDPTALARRISLAAAEVGIHRLRVSLVAADSIAKPPARAIGPWQLEPGQTMIAAEFESDYGTVQNFMGVLPLQLEVLSFQIQGRASGELHTRVVLVTRFLKPGGE